MQKWDNEGQRDATQGSGLSMLILPNLKKNRDTSQDTCAGSFKIQPRKNISALRNTSPLHTDELEPRSVSTMKGLDQQVFGMMNLHRNPVEARWQNYEQRLLDKERKWRNGFGRKLKADLLIKDYSMNPTFVNPLLPTEGELVGMHRQLNVDEILQCRPQNGSLPETKKPRKDKLTYPDI